MASHHQSCRLEQPRTSPRASTKDYRISTSVGSGPRGTGFRWFRQVSYCSRNGATASRAWYTTPFVLSQLTPFTEAQCAMAQGRRLWLPRFTIQSPCCRRRLRGAALVAVYSNSSLPKLLVLRCSAPPGFERQLDGLDKLVRQVGSDGEELVDRTDDLLVKSNVGLSSPLLERLRDARSALLRRRLERSGS